MQKPLHVVWVFKRPFARPHRGKGVPQWLIDSSHTSYDTALKRARSVKSPTGRKLLTKIVKVD